MEKSTKIIIREQMDFEYGLKHFRAEADILRRGRNASGISVPKHATPADYRKATGFECLFGYLYLCGQTARLRTALS